MHTIKQITINMVASALLSLCLVASNASAKKAHEHGFCCDKITKTNCQDLLYNNIIAAKTHIHLYLDSPSAKIIQALDNLAINNVKVDLITQFHAKNNELNAMLIDAAKSGVNIKIILPNKSSTFPSVAIVDNTWYAININGANAGDPLSVMTIVKHPQDIKELESQFHSFESENQQSCKLFLRKNSYKYLGGTFLLKTKGECKIETQDFNSCFCYFA